MKGLLPALVVGAIAVWLAVVVVPNDPAGSMPIRSFGQIPVVYQGRIKPFDTLARNSLQIISDRQTFLDESGADRAANGQAQPAIKWLLDVMSNVDAALHHKVFRIESLDLLHTLGLEPRLVPKSIRYRYAYAEMRDGLPVIEEQLRRALALDPVQRDVYQNQIIELAGHVRLFLSLWDRTIPHVAPPLSAADQWKAAEELSRQFQATGRIDPAAASLAAVLGAYEAAEAKQLRNLLINHHAIVQQRLTEPQISKVKFEVFFNGFAPFYRSAVLYLIAFVLGCLGWLGWTAALNRAAFWLIAFTLVVHSLGLVSRIYISGRPPVTNLYSSAVFIGWGCVVLGLILEAIYRLGVGNLLAAVAGFTTLLIAHFLAGDGDTFQMLQAVLDTQFWLATHVVCVTLGYSTTYMAGLLGMLFILRGVLLALRPRLAASAAATGLSSALGRMIYGTLCFALFFSFLGTVLGGLWADDSWGRFWGWDPKENGALIIVLWNALILHARWGGMVWGRGLAVLAVFGNVVVSWSWFGVNQLGVGLHAYGFTDSTSFWLILFVVLQFLIMSIGMLPLIPWSRITVEEACGDGRASS